MSSTLDRSRNYYLNAAENDQIRKELVGKYKALEGKAVMRRLTRSQLKSRRMLIGVLRRTGNGGVVWTTEKRHEKRSDERETANEYRKRILRERMDARHTENVMPPSPVVPEVVSTPEKMRILLSSSLVGGREMWEAIAAAGVEVFDFCDALERVDAFELALEIRQSRGQGRRGEDEFPPILLHRHALLRSLSDLPVHYFPYRIEFVFRAEDARAKPCLTQPQLWYESGHEDRVRGNVFRPPTADDKDPRTRAYRDGWIQRNREHYFPSWVEGRQEVEEGLQRIITLRRDATLKDLWNAFPGGQSALLKRLEQQQCVSFVRREFVCDPESKRVLIENAFPTDQFGDAWLRETLGVEFEEE